jgi:hypothetical protein
MHFLTVLADRKEDKLDRCGSRVSSILSTSPRRRQVAVRGKTSRDGSTQSAARAKNLTEVQWCLMLKLFDYGEYSKVYVKEYEPIWVMVKGRLRHKFRKIYIA